MKIKFFTKTENLQILHIFVYLIDMSQKDSIATTQNAASKPKTTTTTEWNYAGLSKIINDWENTCKRNYQQYKYSFSQGLISNLDNKHKKQLEYITSLHQMQKRLESSHLCVPRMKELTVKLNGVIENHKKISNNTSSSNNDNNNKNTASKEKTSDNLQWALYSTSSVKYNKLAHKWENSKHASIFLVKNYRKYLEFNAKNITMHEKREHIKQIPVNERDSQGTFLQHKIRDKLESGSGVIFRDKEIFFDKGAWLSSHYACKIEIDGKRFGSVAQYMLAIVYIFDNALLFLVFCFVLFCLFWFFFMFLFLFFHLWVCFVLFCFVCDHYY